jgi:lipopolysaccharide transport system ATP-binding protein
LDEGDPNLFWALRGVSFEIRDGEVVGFLGRNGAGKSTLLKILSRITAPTEGSAKIRGRVASLLEVGTGFHQELTGRDNVFLNGAILGMRHREIVRKLDEIIAFSGVEQFIDTPVKRYSVGMRVRLAFAVAAHLEPEILLIDEVLAVGDAAFQRKCLGKISDISQSGRTVLFVSHSAASIEALCTRGIVLEKGRLVFDGTQTDALDVYSQTRSASIQCLKDRTDRTGSGEVRIVGIECRNAEGGGVSTVRSGETIELALRFERRTQAKFPKLSVQIMVATHLGAPVFTQTNALSGDEFPDLPESGMLVCRLPRLPLAPGHYQIGFRVQPELKGRDALDAIEIAADLPVEPGDFYGTGKLPPANAGCVLIAGNWRLESDPLLA